MQLHGEEEASSKVDIAGRIGQLPNCEIACRIDENLEPNICASFFGVIF